MPPQDGTMRIGVISDTHGEVHSTNNALRVLDSLDVSLILHCGDVGLDVVPLFRGRPTRFVPGNTDDSDLLRRAMADPQHALDDPLGSLEIEGCHIAFLHGDDVKLLHHTIHSGNFDLVCHGHTHAFLSRRERKTLSLNPGAIARTQRPSLAVVEIPSLDVTHVPL
jgi:uncharacterized protein